MRPTVTNGPNAVHVCSLCRETFTGYGHNPAPLAHHDERCCDDCNAVEVIPARLRLASTHGASA